MDKKWEARHLFDVKEPSPVQRNAGIHNIVSRARSRTFSSDRGIRAKSPLSVAVMAKSAEQLGDAIRKAMVWEIGTDDSRQSAHHLFMREAGGMDLRTTRPAWPGRFFSTPQALGRVDWIPVFGLL